MAVGETATVSTHVDREFLLGESRSQMLTEALHPAPTFTVRSAS